MKRLALTVLLALFAWEFLHFEKVEFEMSPVRQPGK
jgi:hypothetical protein